MDSAVGSVRDIMGFPPIAGGAGKARFNVATLTTRLVRDRYMYSIRITV